MAGDASLLGRTDELRRVAEVLAAARNGRGGALLVLGEPGIGKSSLLTAATARARGLVLRVDGYESEQDLAFGAVQRLVRALRPHLPAIPANQRDAVVVAVGEVAGPPTDRYLVGLALLSLLAAAGDVEPVVCVVDDAHHLDPESRDALGFVARRLGAEQSALLLAGRDDEPLVRALAGVPTLRLPGLDVETSVQLLRSSRTDAIDPATAVVVARATGGNPLALVDLAADLSLADLTEHALGDEPVPVGTHLEKHYLARVRDLPAPVQTWLVLAAACSAGGIGLVQAAEEQLGVAGCGDAAEGAGLVHLGDRVAFRHPLVRSAAYHAADGPTRRRVHRALSTAADRLGLVELEAWHAARATVGTDDDVADRLERVADLAAQRGGWSSRARVLTRAAGLTSSDPRRAGRLLGAADAALTAGAGLVAADLVTRVDEAALGRSDLARLVRVRVSLAMFRGDPELRHGSARMLEAAALLHGTDPRAEQEALVQAFVHLLPAERLALGVDLPELGHRLAAGADVAFGPIGDLLRGLAAHVLQPYPQAVPAMRTALASLTALTPVEQLRLGAVGVVLATALWDVGARRALVDRAVVAARETGALQALESQLWTAAVAELHGGTPRQARRDMEQVREVRRALGYDAEHVVNVGVLAWDGAPREHVEALAAAAGEAGFGGVRDSGTAALAVRDLAEGRHGDAYARLRPLVRDPFLQVTPHELPDFVEAAARSGHRAEAEEAVERLEEIAAVTGSSWADGVAHRSRALVSDDAHATEHHRAAVEQLEAAGTEVDLARAHLLHGEWLRRHRRRSEAAEHLRTAQDLLDRAGAQLFLARVRGEEDAAGVAPTSDRTSLLTPQETTVARLAAAGRTNTEIGAEMFLSSHTVDYHLRKVFQKLGVSSRRQLVDRLAAP